MSGGVFDPVAAGEIALSASAWPELPVPLGALGRRFESCRPDSSHCVPLIPSHDTALPTRTAEALGLRLMRGLNVLAGLPWVVPALCERVLESVE